MISENIHTRALETSAQLRKLAFGYRPPKDGRGISALLDGYDPTLWKDAVAADGDRNWGNLRQSKDGDMTVSCMETGSQRLFGKLPGWIRRDLLLSLAAKLEINTEPPKKSLVERIMESMYQ